MGSLVEVIINQEFLFQNEALKFTLNCHPTYCCCCLKLCVSFGCLEFVVFPSVFILILLSVSMSHFSNCMQQILESVGYCHQMDVTHRDVKVSACCCFVFSVCWVLSFSAYIPYPNALVHIPVYV